MNDSKWNIFYQNYPRSLQKLTTLSNFFEESVMFFVFSNLHSSQKIVHNLCPSTLDWKNGERSFRPFFEIENTFWD